MPAYDKILDRKKEASGQVSAQTRAYALGMMAISWALLTAHDEPLKSMAAHASRYLMLSMSVVGMLVLALTYCNMSLLRILQTTQHEGQRRLILGSKVQRRLVRLQGARNLLFRKILLASRWSHFACCDLIYLWQ